MPSASKAKKAASKATVKRGAASKPAAASPAAAASGPAEHQAAAVQLDVQLIFPPALTPRQRAAVHAVGERYGVPHGSQGEGAERCIALGPTDAPAVVLGQGGASGPADASNTADDASGAGVASGATNGSTASSAPSPFTDDQLAALIKQHLNLDATEDFAAMVGFTCKGGNGGGSSGGAGGAAGRGPARAGAAAGGGAPWQRSKEAAAAKPGAKGLLSPEAFIAQMLPLLEMEREAEVAQAEEALAAGSPESAAAKGRALLNLRLTDAEGGLLGRTLLTLVNNKGGGTEPLPAHKLSPHDIVRLRPSKGEGSGPPLAEGVVYRVRDAAITIAVDEVPDDGLDVPLRLEKMANEVTYKRLRAALMVGACAYPAGGKNLTVCAGVLCGGSLTLHATAQPCSQAPTTAQPPDQAPPAPHQRLPSIPPLGTRSTSPPTRLP